MPVPRKDWIPARGEQHKCAKLTEQDVISIRKKCAAGIPQIRIAEEFRMSASQINRIIKGKRWAHKVTVCLT